MYNIVVGKVCHIIRIFTIYFISLLFSDCPAADRAGGAGVAGILLQTEDPEDGGRSKNKVRK